MDTEDRIVPSRPSASDVLRGLLDEPQDGPILRPDAIEAGRRRAAGAPLDGAALADALVAEGPPLLQRT